MEKLLKSFTQEVTMRIKGLMSSVAVAAVAVAFLAGPSNASTVVYQDSVDTLPASPNPYINGLQQWVGNLGMEFQVNTGITVNALGAFDNDVPAGLSGTTGSGVVVGIFNVSTGLLVGTSVVFSTETPGTQIGADAFQNVTPFNLGPGKYEIVSLNDPNYNQGFFNTGPNQFQTLNSLGGALSFIGTSYYDSNSGLDLPGSVDTGPVDRYDAGTFAASALATPLPSTWTMLIAGFIGLGFFAYRGSRKSAAVLAA
jgi:hypothetical protein